MSKGDGDESQRESSSEEEAESYSQPDFKTLGSVAAIGELVRQSRGNQGNGKGNGNGRGNGNGNGRGGPSSTI